MRLEEMQADFEKEITKALVVILELGTQVDLEGMPTFAIGFGDLFQEYSDHSDSVSGVLMRAKRHGLVQYAEQGMLIYGKHNASQIYLLPEGVERAQAWQRKMAAARESMRQSMSLANLPRSLPEQLAAVERFSLSRSNTPRSRTGDDILDILRSSSSPAVMDTQSSRNNGLATSVRFAEQEPKLSQRHWRRLNDRHSTRLNPDDYEHYDIHEHVTFSAYGMPVNHGNIGRSAPASETPHLMEFLSAGSRSYESTCGYPDAGEVWRANQLRAQEEAKARAAKKTSSTPRTSMTRRFSDRLLRKLSLQRTKSMPAMAEDYDDYEEEEENVSVASQTVQSLNRSSLSSLREENERDSDNAEDDEQPTQEDQTQQDEGDEETKSTSSSNQNNLFTMHAALEASPEADQVNSSRRRSSRRMFSLRRTASASSVLDDNSSKRRSSRLSSRRASQRRSGDDDDVNNIDNSERDEDEYGIANCTDGVAAMVSLASNKLAEGAAGLAEGAAGLAENAQNWRMSRRFSSERRTSGNFARTAQPST